MRLGLVCAGAQLHTKKCFYARSTCLVCLAFGRFWEDFVRQLTQKTFPVSCKFSSYSDRCCSVVLGHPLCALPFVCMQSAPPLCSFAARQCLGHHTAVLELSDGGSCNRRVVVLEPLGEKLQAAGGCAGTSSREDATDGRPRWDCKLPCWNRWTKKLQPAGAGAITSGRRCWNP